MKKIKFILFLMLMLSVALAIGTSGCKGKEPKAVTEEASHALEEGLYDPCSQDIEE